ncbi:MAG: 4Fe-4S dicluster domain-containing protein [Acidobacteriia bacterium]|nr:4Fe-4S dicluster domain-containing protein [Terriglobia bacterium]
MTETSDPSLLSEVRKYGVFNARGCFACGSCTIDCDLANDSASFPRRSMQSVVLGLKDSVHQSLDPWLCHDCGDCSTTCPREAKPRESMKTLRRYLTAQYDWTGLSRRICRSPAREIAALSSVAVFVLALIVLYHLYVEHVEISVLRSTSMGMEHMFGRITYFTVAVFLIPAFFMASNVARMLPLTMRHGPNEAIPLKFYLAEAKTIFLEMVTHERILKCPASMQKRRWAMHWCLAFGCSLMFVIKFFFLRWFQTDKIYPLYNPQRWLGYLAFAGLLVGSLDILIERTRKAGLREAILPVLLLLTALSGMAVHILRYVGLGLGAHYAYAVHLMIAVPMLLVEVPFGSSSHMIYRPLALYFAAVKERALEAQAVKEEKTA